jgi:hypothetical protein
MTAQLDLFTAALPTVPLIGLSVELSDSCKCGGTVALTGAGRGPHRASLHCSSCGAHRGWLSRGTCTLINGIITRFGPLTAPIVIRRGERIRNNSGSHPECIPAAQPANTEYHIMRKHELFPSNYYNSKNVSTAIIRTIDYATTEPVGEGANQQQKLVAHFKEPDSKLLVVTSTKYDAISLIARSDETDDWPGTQIVLEPGKVPFQGKLVDSINIRPPRKPSPQRGTTLKGRQVLLPVLALQLRLQNPILMTSSTSSKAIRRARTVTPAPIPLRFLQFLQFLQPDRSHKWIPHRPTLAQSRKRTMAI